METELSYVEKLDKAAQEYLNRKSKKTFPKGSFHNHKWYPSEEEKRNCCFAIRHPSIKFPYSLLGHCRTIKHIANVFGVKLSDLEKHMKGKPIIVTEPPKTKEKIIEYTQNLFS